jgi:hypothetical protein
VFFQNSNQQPIGAFDGNNQEIAARNQLAYNPATARFYLPIRVADIPSSDAAVMLRFVISGQIISEVRFLSALKSLELDVVVPDPVPIAPCYIRCCPPRGIRAKNCTPFASLAQSTALQTAKATTVPGPQPEFRRWTELASGRTQLAKLDRVESDRVYFIRDNGRRCVAEINELSQADQHWIQRWQATRIRQASTR